MSLGSVRSRALYLPIPGCAVCRRNVAAEADGHCSQIGEIAVSRDVGALGVARAGVGYALRDKQLDEGPGLDLASDPGPSMRSARNGLCAGPLCLPEPGAVQCLGEGHWGCSGSRAIGSTTVRAVPCRFGSAGAAITATCTAAPRARGSAVASAPGGRARAINAPVAARTATPPGSGPTASVRAAK